MKPLRWSAHARDALRDRGIDQIEAEQALTSPEFVVPDSPGREVSMRRYHDTDLGQTMLLRIVAEEADEKRVVVTLYKTSRIAKYLRGLTP